MFLSGEFLCVRSHTFAERLYRLAQNARKKTDRRKREREFFETQITMCALIYSALLTVENLRTLHKLYPEEWDRTLAVHRPKLVS